MSPDLYRVSNVNPKRAKDALIKHASPLYQRRAVHIVAFDAFA